MSLWSIQKTLKNVRNNSYEREERCFLLALNSWVFKEWFLSTFKMRVRRNLRSVLKRKKIRSRVQKNLGWWKTRSNLFTGVLRFLFVVLVVVIVIEVGAVVVLGLFVVDQRRIVAAAQLRLDLGGRDGLAISCGRGDGTRTRASTDGRVWAAAVQSASLGSYGVSRMLSNAFRSSFEIRKVI